MFNIMKYEWIKRWKFFLAGLVLFLLLDIDLVNRVLHQVSPTGLAAALGAVLMAMVMALFFGHILRMYSTLFSDEGLLFLTIPVNGYQFLGAKLLAVVIECLAVAGFVGIVGYIDYLVVAPLLGNIPFHFTIPSDCVSAGGKIIFLGLLSYVTLLLMVYLSMVLAKSIFAPVKHGKVLSFIIFLVMSKALTELGVFVDGQGLDQIGTWVFMVALVALLFGLTGYLLDRKINI
ncbi:hypothetical protein [Candidatus Formimonas warabiya]|uniref:ABC transporter permease n=1 Tax=Formimonas warabiya TaxID=1761012 RepID=A0A3G1KVZ0_FORW1|nr:hypothetical protein [Candidatus Formimonas warabiya]ATW26616.1 hypothetical protein DCMF_19335 [Candidatus Formimonas warabiya]